MYLTPKETTQLSQSLNIANDTPIKMNQDREIQPQPKSKTKSVELHPYLQYCMREDDIKNEKMSEEIETIQENINQA